MPQAVCKHTCLKKIGRGWFGKSLSNAFKINQNWFMTSRVNKGNGGPGTGTPTPMIICCVHSNWFFTFFPFTSCKIPSRSLYGEGCVANQCVMNGQRRKITKAHFKNSLGKYLHWKLDLKIHCMQSGVRNITGPLKTKATWNWEAELWASWSESA